MKILFSNFESLFLMHRDVILPDLQQVSAQFSWPIISSNQAKADTRKHFGDVFIAHSVYLKMYSFYVNNFDLAASEIPKLGQKKRKFKLFCSVWGDEYEDANHAFVSCI